MSEDDDLLAFPEPSDPERAFGNTGRLELETALASLGESIHEVAQKFDRYGAIGVIAVDASALESVERTFGDQARCDAMQSVASVVSQLIGERLQIADLIVAGESGRNEMLVLLFRDVREAKFYTRELPDLQHRLEVGLRSGKHRIGYPHLKVSPRLPLGFAAALRNPTLGAETQVRVALEEARREAEFTERVAARKRRKSLFELVLEGRVRSVYEPIVDVKTRTVFGYEALARGPEGSDLHSAGALFASATDEDLMFQLDCLCRRSGLDGARDFPAEAKLFLNIRPTTIHDPSFRADAVRRTLEVCGLQPSDVVLEISEQESIANFAIFREIRDYYRNLGFQIALDDVGSGYASLEAVIELAPEFIKVDRAFVSRVDEDPARQQLLRALHSISSQIGAQIVGEGLDTLEELETLEELGIPFGQGWLFGKPHPLRTDT